jgi:hypothetical protein
MKPTHISMTYSRIGWGGGVAIWCGLVWMSGCGGSETVSTDVKRTAAERPDIDRKVVSAGSLVVPGRTAFNITSVQSAQTGTGRGTAEFAGNNGAKCEAEARDGGSAWGEFQLGYCFDNLADQPLQAAVKLRLKETGGTSLSSRERAATTRPAEPPTRATSSLVFFIKDTNGIVLKKEQLFSGDLDKGAGSNSAGQDLVFDVRFEPGRGYYLVVSGRVDAQAAAADNVVSSLQVADLAMEIDWQPAAPAGASASVGDKPPAPASP